MGWEGGKGQRRAPEALGMARSGARRTRGGHSGYPQTGVVGAKRARVLRPSGKGGAGEQGGAPQGGTGLGVVVCPGHQAEGAHSVP